MKAVLLCTAVLLAMVGGLYVILRQSERAADVSRWISPGAFPGFAARAPAARPPAARPPAAQGSRRATVSAAS